MNDYFDISGDYRADLGKYNIRLKTLNVGEITASIDTLYGHDQHNLTDAMGLIWEAIGMIEESHHKIHAFKPPTDSKTWQENYREVLVRRQKKLTQQIIDAQHSINSIDARSGKNYSQCRLDIDDLKNTIKGLRHEN